MLNAVNAGGQREPQAFDARRMRLDDEAIALMRRLDDRVLRFEREADERQFGEIARAAVLD